VSSKLDGTPTENVNIISNLRYNLSYPLENNYRLYKEGSSTELVDNAADIDTTKINYYDAKRATYTYNGTVLDEAKYSELVSDGYKKNTKNMVYEVTVTIYDSKTGQKSGEYTGGMSD
jgi:asparagine N-glycosylation enzyme membrane subunit Stt3